jgi:hypothetical protein
MVGPKVTYLSELIHLHHQIVTVFTPKIAIRVQEMFQFT